MFYGAVQPKIFAKLFRMITGATVFARTLGPAMFQGPKIAKISGYTDPDHPGFVGWMRHTMAMMMHVLLAPL
jgi:hypothetical protein